MAGNARFKILDNQTINTGQSYTSKNICVGKSMGFFSIDGNVAGEDSLVIFKFLYGDGVTMREYPMEINPDGVTNDNFLFSFQPDYCSHIAIKATNDGTGAAVINCRLNFSENY